MKIKFPHLYMRSQTSSEGDFLKLSRRNDNVPGKDKNVFKIFSSGDPQRISWFKFLSFQLQSSPNHTRLGLYCISPNTCFSSKKVNSIFSVVRCGFNLQGTVLSMLETENEMNFITGKSSYWAGANGCICFRFSC